MKKSVLVFSIVGCSFISNAQWTTNGSGDATNNNASGKVGIGTSSPSFRLHLKGLNSNSDLMTLGGATTGNFALTSADGGAYGLFAGVSNSGRAWLQVGRYDTNTAYDLVLQASGGNVGIGTNGPSQKLEVNGSIIENSENSAFGIDAGSSARLGFIKKSGLWPVLASDATSPIVFSQSNQTGIHSNIGSAVLTERMRIDINGNVGIGTAGPSFRLHIRGLNPNSDLMTLGSATTGNFALTSADGGAYGLFGGVSNTGRAWLQAGRYDTNTAYDLTLQVSGGNVGIGTTSPQEKLHVVGNAAVKGQVHANEVKVDLTVPGPDYVFEKDYKLTSLEDIKTYIDQNKHLPEVPSAKEMEKNGVQLGEMNMLLLKKIEELTLHLIELNKKVDEQNNQIEKLKNKPQ